MLSDNARAGIEAFACAIERAERKRARRMATAVECWKDEPEGGMERAKEAMKLATAAKETEQDFTHDMAEGIGNLITAATGITRAQFYSIIENGGMEGALEAIGIALNEETGDLGVVTIDADGSESFVSADDLPPVPGEEPDPDTTPVGEATIEGIDMDSLAEPPVIDFDGGRD